MREILLDTGPLVALLHRDDQWHSWTLKQSAQLAPPFLTCEAVLTEAHYLLRSLPVAQAALLGLVRDGFIQPAFRLAEENEPLSKLLTRYANVPMSLADACLVRMSEIFDDGTVWTTDSDFLVYRKHRRQAIPLILPPP